MPAEIIIEEIDAATSIVSIVYMEGCPSLHVGV